MAEKKVDESWKERVVKEQETTEHGAASSPQPKVVPEEPQAELPPADFGVFVSSLGVQALMALGEIENPMTGKQEKDFVQAKYLIDTLGMIDEKTKGNLTQQESQMIEQMLYELRLKYVGAGK
jgi:hypothetical protein